MNVVTHLILHGVLSSPEFEHALRWPTYVVMVVATFFVLKVFLPDAWHYRRDDPGGLFFVLVMLAFFVSYMWLA